MNDVKDLIDTGNAALTGEEQVRAKRRILQLTIGLGVNGVQVIPEDGRADGTYQVQLDFESGSELSGITVGVATASGMAICDISNVEVAATGTTIHVTIRGVPADNLRNVREWGR